MDGEIRTNAWWMLRSLSNRMAVGDICMRAALRAVASVPYQVSIRYGTTKAFEEVLRWMASSEWMSVYPCSLVLTEGESSPIGYFMAFSFENEIFLKNQCLWLFVLSFPFVFLSIFDGVAIWMDGDERSMPSHSFLLARTMFKPIKALMRFRVLEFY